MIELQNVYKNYGLTKALIDVSFSIEKGEIIGFVGPNGAGKSTAMKIITTYTAPTSGTATIGGYDVLKILWRSENSSGICRRPCPSTRICW